MTVRIFKHDRNELLKQGIEIISSTNDTKYHNRVVLVNLLLTGRVKSCSDPAHKKGLYSANT